MSAEGEFTSRAEEESTAARPRSKRKSRQTDAAADPVLPEKKRARRRLVGAIALVLAAVIGLPMVLDPEPKPLANDIEIRIPSKDQSDNTRKLRAPAVPAEAALDPSEQLAEPVESSPSASQQTALADNAKDTAKPAVDSKAAQTKPQPVENPAAKANAAPAPKQTVAEAKAVEKTESNAKANAARAKAILEGKPESKVETAQAAADKKPGKYMIQVAALSNQEKIAELRNKMKAAGIPSHTQKVATASGERTRIRVGPLVSKDEAEKVRAKLAKLGLNGSMVPLGN